MFNKPALFPKTPDPQSARGPRTMPGAAPGAPAGLAPAGLAPAVPSAPTGPSSGMAKPNEDAPASDAGTPGDSCLIVGPNVKLKGAQILDCDTLVVEGRVEATMDSRVLRIAEKGAFVGTVGVDVAEIHGRFEGELTARNQLIIHATGRVSGKIRYGKIFIEEGGEISGDIKSAAAGETVRSAEKRPTLSESPIAAAG